MFSHVATGGLGLTLLQVVPSTGSDKVDLVLKTIVAVATIVRLFKTSKTRKNAKEQ